MPETNEGQLEQWKRELT